VSYAWHLLAVVVALAYVWRAADALVELLRDLRLGNFNTASVTWLVMMISVCGGVAAVAVWFSLP